MSFDGHHIGRTLLSISVRGSYDQDRAIHSLPAPRRDRGPRHRGPVVSQAAPQATDSVPTFTRDVAPILYANCVTCHRPGEIAPMPLISYQEVRPWARAISKQIADGVMPPWHADAPNGTFSNERKLTASEKATIEQWAAGGAPEGGPSDLKPPPTFAQGWRIGTPDAIFEMEEDYPVPARGTISVRALLHSDELQRGEVAQGHRGASRQSCARASHPRLLRSPARRSACGPGDPTESRTQPDRGAERARQPATAPYGYALSPAGNVRAGNRRAGVSSRYGAAVGAGRHCFTCRCTTPPTARPAPIAARWA